MKFKDYLEENNINLAAFCRMHMLPYSTTRDIAQGKECFLSHALAIEKATKGKVTCKDMAPTVERKKLQHLRKVNKNIEENKRADKENKN